MNLLERKLKKIIKTLMISSTPLIVTIIAIALIPTLVITYIGEVLGDLSIYEQECPELVRAYLNKNYEKFETKVNSLCDNSDFLQYIAGLEFDNAYTKLVYGGTGTYTQDELKGNYEGTQGKSATWVTKNGTSYSAQSVLEKIDEYKKSGLSDSDITIRDEYLLGYGESSGITEKEGTLSYSDWIKSSFYNIPFYYHWASAKSAGTESSYFSWRDDPPVNWTFSVHDGIYGTFFDKGSDIWKKVPYEGPYKNMTYEEYLNKNFNSIHSKNANKKTAPYIMMEAPLCYKQEPVKGFLTKVLRKIKKQDTYMNYTMYSLMNTKLTNTDYDGVADISDDMYIYDWYKEKNKGKTNYEKYIKDLSTSQKKTYSKREGKTNEIVETWKNNFAEFFAKEIYYTYPNRQYIMDYFMSDKVDEDKKIAFLQRSFYSMATGASLDVNLNEEYEIKNGEILSSLTEKNVGSINYKNITLKNIKPTLITTIDNSLMYNNATGIDNANNKYKSYKIKNFNELNDKISEFSSNENLDIYKVSYKATFVLHLTDGKTKEIKNVPIEYGYDENNKEYVSVNKGNVIKKTELEEMLKEMIEWNQSYYDEQAVYDNDNFTGQDQEATFKKNPLDKISFKLNNWYYSKQGETFTGKFMDRDFSSNSLKNFFKEENEEKDNTLCSSLFNGKAIGEREINFKYRDHSFLTYKVAEKKDSSGKVTSINIEIYTYFPDLSEYDEGTYRIAYGFETEGALSESMKLLDYVNEKKTLKGVKKEVDFNQIIISDDEKWAANGYLTNEDSDLSAFIAEMLIAVESNGNWASARNPYPQFPGEKTITVGIMQWYGGRAHNLLRYICRTNKTESVTILSTDLYNECLSKNDWVNQGRIFSETELNAIRKMLGKSWAKECQKEQLKKDIEGYIEIAKKHKLTNSKLIAYFCNLYHQNPANAVKVAESLIKAYSSAKETNSANDAIDKMYTLSMQYSGFFSTQSRHQECYQKCKNMNDMSSSFKVKGTKNAKEAIQFAISKSGCKYSQAERNSGSKFDCSSLMYYSWKYAGVDISNGKGQGANTEDELKWCEKNAASVCKGTYDASKLKAGDLIFFNTNVSHYRSVGHVAMYIGNNQVVEAGDPVGVYNVSSWHTSNFMEAYRITTK